MISEVIKHVNNSDFTAALEIVVLYVLAIALLLTAVVILIVRHDFVFRTFAMIVCVASARLVRMAVQRRSVSLPGKRRILK